MGKGLGGQKSLVWRCDICFHVTHPASKKTLCELKISSTDSDPQLTLLRTLILWALSSSDTVKGIIQASYKQSRHEDDLNQPLSVQPWGSDSDKRRYYLIEGLDDTHFRVYRESNYTGLKRTWWSVAGDIDELKALAEKLANDDGGQKARLLSSKMLAAVPRFEATEEVGCSTDTKAHHILTSALETKASRIPSNSQAAIQETRA